MDSYQPGLIDRLLALFGYSTDPTQKWAKSDEPLPVFDLSRGALGELRLEDGLEQAEFLGRPDRTVRSKVAVDLYYTRRGFTVSFELGRFVELECAIAQPSSETETPGEGCCTPRLSGGIQLTPATTVAQVRQYFGTERTEENYSDSKCLTFVRGRFFMTFEFEQPKERLLRWTAALDD